MVDWNMLLGFALGGLLTYALMWRERKWREENLRSAERRARLASRHEQMGRYVKALQQCISMYLCTREEWFTNRAEQGGFDSALKHWDKLLKESRDRAQALEMACGWEFSLEDDLAHSLLIQLELWDAECLLYWEALKDGESSDAPQVDRKQLIEVTRNLLKRLDETSR